MMSLPSYWKDFSDPAGATLSMSLTALRPNIRRQLVFSRMLILCGLLVAILNAFSMRLIFASPDRLSEFGMTSIGFSLAIASSLFGFTLYSIFIMRGKGYAFTVAGLLSIITGGILISS